MHVPGVLLAIVALLARGISALPAPVRTTNASLVPVHNDSAFVGLGKVLANSTQIQSVAHSDSIDGANATAHHANIGKRDLPDAMNKERLDLLTRYEFLECWDLNQRKDFGTWLCGGLEFNSRGYNSWHDPFDGWLIANPKARRHLADPEKDPMNFHHRAESNNDPGRIRAIAEIGWKPHDSPKRLLARQQQYDCGSPLPSSTKALWRDQFCIDDSIVGADAAAAEHAAIGKREDIPVIHTLNRRASDSERKELDVLMDRFELLECWDLNQRRDFGRWDCGAHSFLMDGAAWHDPFDIWLIANPRARKHFADPKSDVSTFRVKHYSSHDVFLPQAVAKIEWKPKGQHINDLWHELNLHQ